MGTNTTTTTIIAGIITIITIAGIIVTTTITTTITTIITTTCTNHIYTDRRGNGVRVVQLRDRTGDYHQIHKRSEDPFIPRRLVLARRKFSRRAMNTPVSGVEHGIRRRSPLRARGQSSAALVNTPGL